ncbi:pyridoxal phosphate-dependent aminotransferase [Engelhardtia mirabilis]|uniref:Aminotransferase n=1 Tax=Engelhardtia mirabilis TaxID=2528011 RepID=A0A518BNX9_9BACT|nr:Aspartate aminotransferase [Planctomycetes bacterium Pla133]QDV03008.1 Aspartate aminotransferase [Planctomycetes bacterium Pla86]
MRLSARAEGVALSITLALDARAKELAASGRDVVNMAVGEPDAPAPAVARAAAVARVESCDVRYTPAAGTPSLRRALAAHVTETRGRHHGPEQIVVCHSGKHALSGACTALFDPGDELLIPQPSWVSYVEIARVTGLVPVPTAGRPDCGPDLEALAAACTPRTRGVLINSPCNPSGYVWSRGELATLVELAERHDLWIVSDEIYRRLVYGERPFVSPVELGDAAAARTVIVDGASKTYAMTGYRIGFAAGPAAAIAGIARVHSQMTGSPNTVSQAAYEAVLAPEPPEVAHMVETYARRRTLLLDGLEALGLRTPVPHGAFYAFPDVSEHLGGAADSGEFCARLLEEQGLVLVPGAAFGAPAHVRLSYALDDERIRVALERLATFIGRA